MRLLSRHVSTSAWGRCRAAFVCKTPDTMTRCSIIIGWRVGTAQAFE
jgi:hypothetical protein